MFKSIFEKISKENTQAVIELIISRASFGANMTFGGSKFDT